MGPLVTERLMLRRMDAGDIIILRELIYGDPEVWALYPGVPSSAVEIAAQFTHDINQPRASSFGRMAVILKSTGKPIGQIHLDAYVNEFNQLPGSIPSAVNRVEVELSLAFGRVFWGKGLAYEACQAVIEYAFGMLKVPRLLGSTLIENERALKLQKRLGFELYPNSHPDNPGAMVCILTNPDLGCRPPFAAPPTDSFPVCVRCHLPVQRNQDLYEMLGQMHWLCHHLEFEHTGNPDQPCEDPTCPWARITLFETKLRDLGYSPRDLIWRANRSLP